MDDDDRTGSRDPGASSAKTLGRSEPALRISSEPERQASDRIEDVAVVFLTNRECPYRCLMCDLWKNTTDEPVPVGAIPQQIDYALQRLPPAAHLKLYNAGSFFDPLAISPQDYPAIIERVRTFESLIVENHPNLLGSRLDAFHGSLQQAAPEIRFEVALGLETCHPESLQRLNKRMTLADFEVGCRFLRDRGIAIRVFVLLRAPGLNEADGLAWRSVRWSMHSITVPMWFRSFRREWETACWITYNSKAASVSLASHRWKRSWHGAFSLGKVGY